MAPVRESGIPAPRAQEGLLERVVGRLAPGVEIEQAQAELEGLAAQLAAAFPETNKGRGM